jgi:hypothetical protein
MSRNACFGGVPECSASRSKRALSRTNTIKNVAIKDQEGNSERLKEFKLARPYTGSLRPVCGTAPVVRRETRGLRPQPHIAGTGWAGQPQEEAHWPTSAGPGLALPPWLPKDHCACCQRPLCCGFDSQAPFFGVSEVGGAQGFSGLNKCCLA